jgi:hypothetical protein
MSGSIPLLPNTPSWRGTQLKHRDNFTFIIIIKVNITADKHVISIHIILFI